MVEDEPVLLQLSKDEALVLFDWLSREDGGGELPARDGAEGRALWRLHGALERVLAEPFLASYAERLRTARQRLADLHGWKRVAPRLETGRACRISPRAFSKLARTCTSASRKR
jgi:hypothetical protein